MQKYYVLQLCDDREVELIEFANRDDADGYVKVMDETFMDGVSTWIFPQSQLARIMKLYQQSLKTN